MADPGVQYLIQMLLKDEKFRKNFIKDRGKILDGIELTEEERKGFDVLDVDALAETAKNLSNINKKMAALGSIYI